MNSAGKRVSLPLLVAATASGPLALNIFMPAMPKVADYYDTPYGTVQLTLSVFFLGLALGQIVYGPLSDRFGRRPILIIGMGLFALSSLLCFLAPTIELLIAARAAQAFAGCAGMVLSRAVIGDVAGRDRSASMIAYLTMAMVVVPMVAPMTGGLLADLFDWHAIFFLVFAYGSVVLVWLWFAQVETKHDRQSVSPAAIVGNYWRLVRQGAFRSYAATSALGTAGFFAFLGGAPFVVIEGMGRAPTEFGFFFLGPAACYILGNFFSARLAPSLGVDRLIRIGTVTAMTGSLVMLVAGLSGLINPWALFLPMMIFTFGNGLTIANSLAGAISVIPAIGGTASGLAGFLQMMVGAGSSTLTGNLVTTTQVPIAAVMLAVSTSGVLVAYLTRPGPGSATPAPAPSA